MKRIGGIILAAGTSRRMGQPKLLMPFRGGPLINCAMRAALDGGLEPVVAVIGPGSSPELAGLLAGEPSIIMVRAAFEPVEQSASLKAGLKGLLLTEGNRPVAGACVLLGDQPLITAELVARLASSALANPGCLIAPRFGERRGNPVIIPREFFAEVMALSGDNGARGLFLRPGAAAHYLEVDEQSVIFDIDTPEDYDALLRLEKSP